MYNQSTAGQSESESARKLHQGVQQQGDEVGDYDTPQVLSNSDHLYSMPLTPLGTVDVKLNMHQAKTYRNYWLDTSPSA